MQVHTYDAEMGRTGGGVFNTTLKSGTNAFRGNGFYQVRPIWGQTNNYFSEIAGRPKPESPYRLAGGAVGGPIVKNKTFFWFTTEGYDDTQTRNVSVLFPTAAMRSGDFSALTNATGQPVIIYDPLTGQPFPGNRIPAGRINPVAANMLRYLPIPDTDRDNGSDNYTRTSLIKSKYAQLYSVKLEHKITDSVSLSGFYLYNKTQEPVRELLRLGRSERAEPLRRPQRLLPGPQATDSRAQQHVGAEQQLGAGAALRDDVVPGQQHAQRRLRSANARLLADVCEPDSARQVPAGAHPRLRRPEHPHDGRHQPERRSTGSRRAPTRATRSWSARTRSRPAATGARSASTLTLPATAPGTSTSTRT